MSNPVKGKSLKFSELRNDTQYIACTLYCDNRSKSLSDVTFINCSFRDPVRFYSLNNTSFENCGFSSELVIKYSKNNYFTGGHLTSLSITEYDKEFIDSIIDSCLISLDSLNLNFRASEQELTHLLEKIQKCELLGELGIHLSNLKQFPEKIFEFNNLNSLIVLSGNFETLPEEINQLKELKTLKLDGLGLTKLPETIGDLIKLENLSLNANQLNSFPESMSQLVNLVELRMSENEFQTQIYSRMATLEKEASTNFPIAVGEYHKLKVLDISYNNLLEIPSYVMNCRSLETLIANGCGIYHLPEAISNLKEMRYLDISSNELGYGRYHDAVYFSGDSLEGIGTLTKLEYLDISSNRLRFIPSEINNLNGLIELKASHNKIHHLPDEFSELQSLKRLDFANNFTTCSNVSYPNCDFTGARLINVINKISTLEEVNLSSNEFNNIPSAVKHLTASVLDLSENRIEKLELSNISEYCKKINLQGCGIESIKDERLEKLVHLNLDVMDLSNNNLEELVESIRFVIPIEIDLKDNAVSESSLAESIDLWGTSCFEKSDKSWHPKFDLLDDG